MPISATRWKSPTSRWKKSRKSRPALSTHYLFEAEVFATREEAEEMRAHRVGVIARRFYEELPSALMGRGEKRSNLSARERASARWKRTIH